MVRTIEGLDPAAETLAEALAEQAGPKTLVWGRHVDAVIERLRELGVTDLGTVVTRTFSDDMRSVDAMASSKMPCATGVLPDLDGIERVALLIPRAKDDLAFCLDAIAAAPNVQTIWLSGHTRDGIKPAAKALAARFGASAATRTKRRCRVVVAERPANGGGSSAAATDASAAFDPNAAMVQFDVTDGPRTFVGHSLPGVFAHGRLDAGSRMLLDAIPASPVPRELLDLGSGAGLLGVALATRWPTTRVTMVDSSARACASALATADAAGVTERITIRHAEVASIPRQPPRQVVVVNPPFHDGRVEIRALAERFIKTGYERLVQGGRLYLVANSHLSYAPLMEAHFRKVTVIAESTTFRVWLAIK